MINPVGSYQTGVEPDKLKTGFPNGICLGLFSRDSLVSDYSKRNLLNWFRACISNLEVEPGLVLGAVFKTVGPFVKQSVGGFDSHALPPLNDFHLSGPDELSE